jgi:CRISPR/Cas system CMR-associated protein Cmr1 (group 7 of RAMP superfamily)
MSRYRLKFITPLFSRGAYEDQPEIRPPSIRGQLHWWFRALGNSFKDEKEVFGGVHGGAAASKIVIRVCEGQPAKVDEFPTLPHKQTQASLKSAFSPGTTCDLDILIRLGGLDGHLEQAFDRTLESWLLLGTLGLRGTRAAGSFCWQPIQETSLRYPPSFQEYEARCDSLLSSSPLRFVLLRKVYASAEGARRVVSDTLGGRGDSKGQDELRRLSYPLGRISQGRKTSPLRFRIVGVDDQYRIATVWDSREKVTGNSIEDLRGVIKLLEQRKPELGKQLAESMIDSVS